MSDFNFKPMALLPNGARLIAVERVSNGDTTVLARFHGEWVTWKADEAGHCYWGNYFTDLSEARADYARRRSGNVPRLRAVTSSSA